MGIPPSIPAGEERAAGWALQGRSAFLARQNYRVVRSKKPLSQVFKYRRGDLQGKLIGS